MSQSILEFDKWMQKIERSSQSVQRHLAQRNSAAALTDARELGELYRLMEDYLARRGDPADATRLANDGGALADSVIDSLRNNNFDSASRSARTIAAACRECHIKYKPLDP